MLDVERWPDLRDPVLVLGFTGWVDAGHAGAGALAAVAEELAGARRFATIDLTDLLDLQQVRPTVRFVEGGLRRIDWPRLALVAGNAGRDVVLATGPEPSLRWRAVSAALVDAATRLGVARAVAVGGMPALVSHRRPLAVLATATSRSLAQELVALRPDYAGPTGFQTVVQRDLGDAGIPAIGLWVQVPQYVSGSPCPPAVRALLARLRDETGVALDLHRLDDRCDAYLERLEEGLAERPDVADLVRRLDGEAESLPSGEELASEIERFLRSQPDQD